MVQLFVTVGREITFISHDDLPAGFRRAVAADNTFPNPLAGKRRGVPPTVQAYYHNPFTREVALPRSYWPQLVSRAQEYGVELVASEVREEDPPVIRRQVAVRLEDLAFGMDTLRAMLAGAIPVAWEEVNLQVIATRRQPVPAAEEEDRPRPPAELEMQPFPWEVKDPDG